MNDSLPQTLLETRTLYDPQAHAQEQAALGRHWTLIGCVSDLPNLDDWFTSRLGGLSIFVQRFKEGLRGFVNRCAHRSFPLRVGAKGKGPVVCGFHHWRYDAEGVAVGIPACPMVFGKTPRELHFALDGVELSSCGDLLFARLRRAEAAASLEEDLGASFGVLAALFADLRPALRATIPIAANWRIFKQISLDDYHLAAVHPSTFGHVGYHKAENLNYHRFGAHSAFFSGKDAESLDEMATAITSGDFRHRGYRIFHLFPNVGLLAFRAYSILGEPHWYIAIERAIPEGPGRCTLEVRVARSPFFQPRSRVGRLLEPFAPLRLHLVIRGVKRVLNEDRRACEIMQTEARQILPTPVYGRAEWRVAWFDEVYARALAARNEEA